MTRDHSAWGIVGANLLTIVIALWQGWGLLQLLWPFWIQSVIIGYFARHRMLVLKDFCTAGYRVNGQSVEATPETLRKTANFFAIHYGFFHLVYFLFLVGFTGLADADGRLPLADSEVGTITLSDFGRIQPRDWLLFLGLGAAFYISHRASHREHVAADLAGRPNLGRLMFLPYLRIVPMHLTLILGGILAGGAGVWFFAALKTGADVLMHRIEHRKLQGVRQETER